VCGRFDEGGKLLCLMVQHISSTVCIWEEVKYADEVGDNKLENLRTVLRELKEDYLVQHLHR